MDHVKLDHSLKQNKIETKFSRIHMTILVEDTVLGRNEIPMKRTV